MTKARPPASVTRQAKPLTVSSSKRRLPWAGTGSLAITLLVRRIEEGPVRILSVHGTAQRVGQWQPLSTSVNVFLPMAQGFLLFWDERHVRTKAWAKSPRVDLKSASGKPECRFESGRGHHTRLFRSTSVSPPSAPSAARLGQRDHATPELLTIAGVDVVFAHEREPAIPCDAIDHDPGG